jgi:hypothetical protein
MPMRGPNPTPIDTRAPNALRRSLLCMLTNLMLSLLPARVTAISEFTFTNAKIDLCPRNQTQSKDE